MQYSHTKDGQHGCSLPDLKFAPDIEEIQLQSTQGTLFTLTFPLSHLYKRKALEAIVDTHKLYGTHTYL